MDHVLLRAEGIFKSFGAVEVLKGVEFSINPGEIVALVGENGAGKSTFIKILTGAYHMDKGQIFYMGEPVQLHGPSDSRALGIEAIYQDLALIDPATVTENIFLGKEIKKKWFNLFAFLNHSFMESEARRVLAEAKINIPSVKSTVEKLSGGQRQAVAIARAVYWNARVMIMDEPTAALGVKETAHVVELIQTLKKRGIAIIVISHNLQEVFSIVDRIVVLRHGIIALDKSVKETTQQEVVQQIVGVEENE